VLVLQGGLADWYNAGYAVIEEGKEKDWCEGLDPYCE